MNRRTLALLYESISLLMVWKPNDIGSDGSMDERTKTLLYETLELLREAIMKSGCYSDWKDADDYLFAELGFTKAELLEIYKGKGTLVYIGSAVAD